MKKSFLLNLTILSVLLLGQNLVARAQTTTFNYTGGAQTYTVPTGVTQLLVDMQGAAGGDSWYSSPGGKGGRVQCILNVTPGQVLNLYVGGRGGNGVSSCSFVAGGYNGGASNGTHYYGAAGGGASDIRIGGTALTDRKVVAGGGGGGGYDCTSGQDGGAGGGLTGGAGLECGSVSTCYSGYGGAQTLTANGPGCYGTTTYQGTLGNGAVYSSSCAYGSGGGGGYYGGGAGGYWGTGGGGSSYTNPALCSNVTHTQGFNASASSTAGNGRIVISGPTVTASPTSLAFGSPAPGGTETQLFTISALVLSTGGSLTLTPPTGYELSLDGSTWFNSSTPLTYTYPTGTFSGTPIYVRFAPTAIGSYPGNIVISGGGLTASVNVAVTGTCSAACSAAPTGGTATINGVSSTSGNSSTSFTLSLSGQSTGGGITYQWQSAPTSTGTFTDIPGGTTVPFSYTGMTANTWFRCQVTCPSFGVANSSTVSATFTIPASSCVPTSASTSCTYYVGTTGQPVIINGIASSISDASACGSGTGGSSRYYNNVAQSVTMARGGTYTGTMCAQNYYVTGQIWIDFNDNGVFDNTTETVGGVAPIPCCTTPSTRPAVTLNIPANANPGAHRMRVIGGYTAGVSSPGNSNYPVYPGMNPCPTTTVQQNDIRDYTAVIVSIATVTATPATVAFGNVTTGTTSAPVAYTRLVGSSLSPSTVGTILVTAPSTQFQLSTNGSSWSSSVTIPHAGGTLAKNLYVRFLPTGGSATGNITITGGGLASTINIPVSGTGVSACSGTPTAGTAAVSPSTAAVTSTITLSVTGSSASGGIKYQWQSAPSSGGPFTDMVGAITPTYSFTGMAATTFYRCVVSCPAGGSSNTNVVSVAPAGTTPAAHTCGTIANAMYGYCCGFYIAEAGYPFTINGDPGSVLVDNTTVTSPSYIDVSSTLSVNMSAGGVYTASIGGTGGNMNSLQMWIDFNNDGSFATTEVVGGVTWVQGTAQQFPTITIPSTVASGSYRLRAVVSYTGGSAAGSPPTYPVYPNIPPCNVPNMGYFQMKDYKVNIGGASCTGTPEPGIVSIDPSFACSPVAPSVFNVGSTPGVAGLTYQWQSSTTLGGTYTDISGATGQGYVAPLMTSLGTVYYRRKTTCTVSGQSATNSPMGVTLSSTPNITNFTSPTATNSCSASGSVVTVNSNTLGAGTFTVTYSLSGANTSSNNTATLTMGATSGTFTIPAALLPTNGATTVTINSITQGGCSSNPSASNTATFQVGTNPNVTNFTSPSVPTVCAGANATATVNSTTLGAGTFTVTFALSGANSSTGNTATLTMGASSGTFTIPAALLSGSGSTTLTINSIANASCSSTTASSNTATFSVSANAAAYIMTGGGSYCTGGSGIAVGINVSTTGNTYQLYNGSSTVGAPLAGTGSSINFGTFTATGTYSVLATNGGSGCTRGSSNTVVVSTSAVPTAYALSGGGSYCAGGTGVNILLPVSDAGASYQLYNGATPVGAMILGTGTPISFGTQTMAGTYTAIANPGAGPGCQVPMSGSATVTILSLPTPYSVTGGGNYCTGGSGVPVGVSFAQAGTLYNLYNGSTLVTTAAGTNAALTFGNQTAEGTYSVSAATTGTPSCANNMVGTVTVGTVPTPTAQTVTGSGSACAGSSGVAVGLSGSQSGASYQLYLGSTTVGSAVSGSGSSVSLSSVTSSGVYTVLGSMTTSGVTCTTPMTGNATVVINATPTVFTVTGGGAYCSGGTGQTIGLNGSTAGVDYRLYLGASATPSATVSGTGAAISFGTFTAAGTYTVQATNSSTSCVANMSGAAVISITTPPTAYSVTGGGPRCEGGAGVAVNLSGSQTGVNYQLYRSGVPVGGPIAGTGGGLAFGTFTDAGIYSVFATSLTSPFCQTTQAGSATITVNSLPNVYTVTGGGSYCQGATGVAVGLGGSQSGVTYSLYNGATLVTTVNGVAAGTPVTFGVQTLSGTFTVFAANTATTCTNNMSGSASIAINPLPTAFGVTGTGNYCAGGTGVPVGLGSSQAGVTYNLYNGASLAATASGTGSAISFGSMTNTGTYTVQGTNSTTGCVGNMSGNAVVGVNALPTAFTVTSSGTNYCAGGSGIAIGLTGSQGGVDYQLYMGSTPSGSVVSGTGGSVSFGNRTTAGTYTVMATNTATGCVKAMTSSASVAIDPVPTVYGITGGGNYCSGGTGVNVSLTGSQSGITYQLYNGASAVGAGVMGTGAAISFGSQTTSGTYSVIGTNAGTTCASNMSGVATVGINTLPTAYTVTSSGTNYCAGTTGITIGLSGSTVGVNYQLYLGATAVGSVVPGTGTAITFGSYTGAGTYTAVAVDATTGCSRNMTGSTGISINPAPAAYNVTGGGNYCAGSTGVNIGLNGSNTGVNYQLYNGSLAVGSPVAGTGAALDFGTYTTSGTYVIVGSNGTTSCSTNMTGSASVAINPLPTVYAVTGGGNYCNGGSGLHVGLSGSTAGIAYQLYLGSTPIGSLVSGTGLALDFGLKTDAGSYTVVAYNPATTCFTSMMGSAAINVNALPVVHTVTGGGNYCNGSTSGVNIGLSNSTSGTSYQLYNGSATAGAPVFGTGGAIDFGSYTGVGTYSVLATTISSSCTNAMSGTATVAVSPLPSVQTVTGGGTTCQGSTGVNVYLNNSATGINYQLYNGPMPVGAPVPGTGTALSFGAQTAAGTYTVVATNATTSCSRNMSGSATVVVNAQPAAQTVTGGGSYCAGDAGVAVGLGSSTTGINYQLFNGSTAVGGPVAGTGAAISFGMQTTAGNYTVLATNATTGCSKVMTGTATISVNNLPAAFTVVGGGNVCNGATGVGIVLSGSNTGISYQLYNGSTAVGAPVTGTGGPISFGPQNTAGTYVVVATNGAGCSAYMTGSATVNVNALPTAYVVTGGGDYCSGGTGVDVSLMGTNTGISYQLYNGGVLAGSAVAGNGGAVSFGNQTAAGTYSVLATNTSTGCTNAMTGSATVNVNALPAAYTVSGGGIMCSGDAGLSVTLANSVAGINYQLYMGSTAVPGAMMAGTGGALNFGPISTAGSYNVVAMDPTTSCTKNMNGSATVVVSPTPVSFNITGGGDICAGSTGTAIGLNGSATGVNYQLKNGATNVGTPVAGTGSAISFGLQTNAGNYTVLATNASTGCTATMTGSATINVNAQPSAYSVLSVGSSYCSGGAGVHVLLSGSEGAAEYQLYNNGTATGGAIAGTGGTIDFGAQTNAGNYTVVANNTTTGCTRTMTGSIAIVINPLPTAYNVTGGGGYCNGSAGSVVSLAGSNTGMSYQLYNGTTPVGTAVAGTGAALSFGPQTTGNYNVVATNNTTGCTNSMTGSVAVMINPAPTAYAVNGGGATCAGTAGTPVGLGGSATGVSYQLWLNGTTAVGSAVAGTGSAITFGPQNTAGVYTVKATNNTTTCTANMTGSATITVNSVPVAQTVTGGGNYCAGGAGIAIGLGGSATGINYQLRKGGVAVPGAILAGTGGVLDFGLQTAAGTYDVLATNTATGCTNTMTGTPAIVMNALPSVYSVTGGGSYCATTSATGVAVGLSGSENGVTYQLYLNDVAVTGAQVAGTGVAISFGMRSESGSYTVKATNASTSCMSDMAGAANVIANPAVTPAVTVTTGVGNTVCLGVLTTFTANSVNGGTTPTYQWKVNGSNVGLGLSSYAYVPNNGDVVSVAMTSSEACASPATATGAVTMTVSAHEMPVAKVTVSPNDTVCAGTTVSYSVIPEFGGTAPAFVWKKNGVAVGAGTTYSTIPANGDVITVEMTSNFPCRLEDKVTTDVKMTVQDQTAPVVSIVATPGTSISQGQVVTLAAVATNAINPTYQWKVNGNDAPGNATGVTYVSNNFNNGDQVSVEVTNHGACLAMMGSKTVTMTVSPVGVVSVTNTLSDIRLLPNPNNGDFTIRGNTGIAGNQELNVEITDMLGQAVYRGTVTSRNGDVDQKIQLSKALANGMYILNLRTETEAKVFNFVLQQ